MLDRLARGLPSRRQERTPVGRSQTTTRRYDPCDPRRKVSKGPFHAVRYGTNRSTAPRLTCRFTCSRLTVGAFGTMHFFVTGGAAASRGK